MNTPSSDAGASSIERVRRSQCYPASRLPPPSRGVRWGWRVRLSMIADGGLILVGGVKSRPEFLRTLDDKDAIAPRPRLHHTFGHHGPRGRRHPRSASREDAQGQRVSSIGPSSTIRHKAVAPGRSAKRTKLCTLPPPSALARLGGIRGVGWGTFANLGWRGAARRFSHFEGRAPPQ